MKIYVVIRSIGEYSDRSEHLVKAFKEKIKAQEFVEKSSTLFRAIKEEMLKEDLSSWEEKTLELDSYKNYVNFTGMKGYIDLYSTYYNVEETELEE
jgi:hypothetical protein